jgi:hypothetical protein
MSAISKQILRDALALPPQELAKLVEQLLATLQTLSDPKLVNFGRARRKIGLLPTTGAILLQFERRMYSTNSVGVQFENLISTAL